MGKYTIEHWRDGEVVERFELTHEMFKPLPDGSVCVTFPPGRITIVNKDELHFDPEGIKEIL